MTEITEGEFPGMKARRHTTQQDQGLLRLTLCFSSIYQYLEWFRTFRRLRADQASRLTSACWFLDLSRSCRSISLNDERNLLDSLQLMTERSSPQARTSSAPLSSSPMTISFVNRSQAAIGVRSTLPLSAPNNRTIWKKDSRIAVYRNLESQATASGTATGKEDLKQFLRDASKNPALLDLLESIDFLAKETGTTLFGFMMMNEEDLDLNVPLASLGVDSLVSFEFRNWFRQKVGAEFTVLEVVNPNSVLHLGEQAAAKLKEKFQARGLNWAHLHVTTVTVRSGALLPQKTSTFSLYVVICSTVPSCPFDELPGVWHEFRSLFQSF